MHRCSKCHHPYFISDFRDRCDECGEQLRQIELRVDDGVVEWWELAIEAEFGIEVEQTRRWWIG